jgi:hypothetical protein
MSNKFSQSDFYTWKMKRIARPHLQMYLIIRLILPKMVVQQMSFIFWKCNMTKCIVQFRIITTINGLHKQHAKKI